jgi:hypothetical protein
MHQECNMAESIISMCLNDKKKTKDNFKARMELAELCNRPSLKIKQNANGKEGKTHAPFCLNPNDKKEVLTWL